MILWFETLTGSSFKWDYGNGNLSEESPRAKFDTDESINYYHSQIPLVRVIWHIYALHSKPFGCSREKFW